MNLQSLEITAASLSEVGKVREENQDCMAEASVPFGRVFIIADGMGGHKGGAFAAQLVVQGLLRHLEDAPADATVEEVLTAAFRKVNEKVYAEGHGGDPAIERMGSTAVLVVVSGGTARVAHVGDSRAYLYRDGSLQQLTKDHTVVQRMVDSGMIKPEAAGGHPDASVLERAIGSEQEIKVDIGPEIALSDGDAILLCSDGLHGYVTAQDIESVLQSGATAQEITDQLVKLALRNGGGDNVTVQCIQCSSRKGVTAIMPAKDGERATQAVEERISAAPTSGPSPATVPGEDAERATRAVEQGNAEMQGQGLGSFRRSMLALLALCVLVAGVLAYCAAHRSGQGAKTRAESRHGEAAR